MAVLQVIEARDDLAPYGSNRSTLFVLQIEFQIEDISNIAADAIVDGSDDKGCDVFYLDDESGRAIIAQSYEAAEAKKEASANKAAAFNQTVQWLLAAPIDEVPDRLRPSARDLRDAIEAGSITSIELWYVHNCGESENVVKELERAKSNLRTTLDHRFKDFGPEAILASYQEFGMESISKLYESTQVSISVNDEFAVMLGGAFTQSGSNWDAICGTVPGDWLLELFNTHGEDLFSPNVRGYLGSKRSDKNINNGIKNTVVGTPENFWVFNNGITALVNGFEYDQDGDLLRINGIGIVNGAQTTGSIANSGSTVSDVRVMARFVKCSHPETVKDIIRFNNRQNKVEPADFRSNDQVQTRLRDEFQNIGQLQYSGGRRSNMDDVIRRPGEKEVSFSIAAQALAAFHGDPNLAYNRSSELLDSDREYSRFFRAETRARHVFFVYSLLKQVDESRATLRTMKEDDRTTEQASQAAFFARRGASHLVVAAVAYGLETILGQRIPSRFDLSFRSDLTLEEAKAVWRPIVELVLSLHASLRTATEQGLKNQAVVDEALRSFAGQLEAVKAPMSSIFEDVKSNVTVDPGDGT